MADRQAVRQTVFRSGFFRQPGGFLLNLHAADLELRLSLQQKQPHQPCAAAQVTDPKSGLQPGQGGQEERICAGTEQGVIIDKAVSAGL